MLNQICRFSIIFVFLFAFLILQSILIVDARSAIQNYKEPILAWSTHSAIANTNPTAVLDGKTDTFWADQGNLTFDTRVPVLSTPYDGLWLMVSSGATHNPGKIPVPINLNTIQIKAGPNQFSRPKRIRISYFEQQLFHINHDYKFPDQPIFVSAKDIEMKNSDEWQSFSLDFVTKPLPSIGFPNNVKQRWFRFEIVDIYQQNQKPTAISEIRFIALES